MSRHVCWHSMRRLLGKHHQATIEEQSQMANDLIQIHNKCSQKVSDFSPTVTRPYDNYLMLACHILWEVWHQTAQDQHFWTATAQLYKAVTDSPASYNLRFLLIKFLNQIGAVGASHSLHAGLELKHVQLDSLGYVLTRHIQSCAHFHTAIGMFNASIKFFNSNYKDVSLVDESFKMVDLDVFFLRSLTS